MKKYLIDFRITYSNLIGGEAEGRRALCGALERGHGDPINATISPSDDNTSCEHNQASAATGHEHVECGDDHAPATSAANPSGRFALIGLTPADGRKIPDCEAGQFVEVQMPSTAGVLLRRPISINDIDTETNTLWLLVRNAGRGSEALINAPVGMIVNLLLPLGQGFSVPPAGSRPLLVGGGVGVAPLLYFGRKIREAGVLPTFLLGARTEADLLMLESFASVGDVHISTDDGSRGSRGVVTKNPALNEGWTDIYCCGPLPMMKAVAKVARKRKINCEVSLENMMACGMGACLCCVEDTADHGNVCVCSEGPVFNINRLKWQD